MKVAHVIDSLSVGGAQKLLVTLAEGVRGTELDLHVVSLRDQDRTPVHDELENLGVRVEVFPFDALARPLRLVGLSRFLRRKGYEVVNTHLTYANILGGTAGRMAGIPVVSTLHSTRMWVSGFRRWLERLVLRRWVRRRVAVGLTVADTHRERLAPAELEIIPNAVLIPDPLPPGEVEATRLELAGEASRTILFALGRLVLAKGYLDLFTAFAEISRQRPETVLVIAGEGKLRPTLEARIAELELGGRVVLLGQRDDVPRLLAAADIFVSSSHWEGLPVALLEAMAAGLPVVGTTVGDVPRAVVEGTGLLVPPQEPERLAAAILELVDDPERRRAMGEAAREQIRRSYGVEAWVGRLIALYKEVLS